MKFVRLASAAWCALLAVSSAAQVRDVPAEAVRAPLSAPAFGGMSLNAAPLTATILPSSAFLAPLPTVAVRAASAASAVAAPVAAPAAASLAAATPAAPTAAADAVSFAAPNAASAPRITAAARPAAGIFSPGRAPIAAPALDALFDGRAAAAAEEPQIPRGPALEPAAPAAVSRFSARRKVLAVAVPLAAAAVAGALAPHAALFAVHALGQAAYWLANPLSFLFTIPQIHRMLARRSADVSGSMTLVGLLSAFATTLCFAFDGKDLMMYRNLAQAAGFAAMFGLERRFARVKHAPPSRAAAILETGAVALGLGAAMYFAGPLLMTTAAVLPVLSHLLVPLQILAGFGFTYMMYAQIRKMRADQSAGDSSTGMMWALVGTKTIWVWSLATMLSLAAAPAWRTLAAGTALAGASWWLSRVVFSRLLRAQWSFLPERVVLGRWSLRRAALGDGLAFAAMSALIMGLSAAGWLLFDAALGVPVASASAFGMYAIYTIQNLVSCVATLEALKLQKSLGRAAAPRA